MNKEKTSSEKTLPHNFFAEKMVLSCLIVNPEALEVTSETLPIEAFYFKNHQQIYKSLIFMKKNQLSINIFSLSTFLQENALLTEIGGIGVLIELVKETPNLIDLKQYTQLIKDKFLRRSLIKFGYKTINVGYVSNIPLEKIMLRDGWKSETNAMR